MRIAVISDIHGNCVALDAALADIRRDQVDHLVCLGDAIQGGPQPAEVVARLRDLGCPVVMGNADAWLLSGEETGHEDIPAERLRKMEQVRQWSLAQLSDDDRAFIAQFQPTVQILLEEGCSLLCFHGSPASFDDVILPTTPEEAFQAFLGPHLPQIMTGGHTHLQQIRRIGASDSFFFNPGSIGLAYSHQQSEGDFRADPWAEYAILTADSGRLALEFRRVLYDTDTLIDIYRSSGIPYAADRIAYYT
ncbi:MAG: metallophosphoesterase [Herpetosiphonaceae bacterium]|nr:MAG: metallophosphoesterase [Herpetosiphonaceae bacterium]